MLTSSVIRRRETKTTVRYYYISISTCKTKRRGARSAGEGVEQLALSGTAGENVRLQALRKTSEQSLAKLNATPTIRPSNSDTQAFTQGK